MKRLYRKQYFIFIFGWSTLLGASAASFHAGNTHSDHINKNFDAQFAWLSVFSFFLKKRAGSSLCNLKKAAPTTHHCNCISY